MSPQIPAIQSVVNQRYSAQSIADTSEQRYAPTQTAIGCF